MHYKIQVFPRDLQFKEPASTSRGTYTSRKSWFIVLTSKDDPERWGVGECAPLPGLSCDDLPDYEQVLQKTCQQFVNTGQVDIEGLRNYPSILFGLETAVLQYEANSFALWNTPFARGEQGITINGLVWMGNYEEMLKRITEKIESGFRCIKLKIGAIDFEKELKMISLIREQFSANQIEIRVDANGAFSPDEAMKKLEQLARYDLHSIEQPIRAGQWEEMAFLTSSSPLPIALDEELIGHVTLEEKKSLLDALNPQYIVLKPSLHGGLYGGTEWINEAMDRRIGWWMTSALESNVGLNAIAQWCAKYDNPLAQGLGTGLLYTNNIDMPLEIRDDQLWFNPAAGNTPDLF